MLGNASAAGAHDRAQRRASVAVEAIDLFERDVRLRMPFRFGVVTLTQGAAGLCPSAHPRSTDGTQAEGMAAELLAPKWFDKNPALSNEDNFDQLRAALGIARGPTSTAARRTAFGHFARHYRRADRATARGAGWIRWSPTTVRR